MAHGRATTLEIENMTKLDYVKAIGGALIAVPIIWIVMVVLLAAQP